jgi:hypothetical protein
MLSPDLRQRIRGALAGVFNLDDLNDLLIRHLYPDLRLDRVVAVNGRTVDAVVNDLLTRVESDELVEKLLGGMLDLRPRNRTFLELAAELNVQAPVPTAIVPAHRDPVVIQVRVTRFSTLFNERRQWFGYLDAYKRLHDSVHELQEKLEAVREAVRQARRQPPSRGALKIIEIQLRPHVAAARSAVSDTESPDEHRGWVEEYAQAVAALRAVGEGGDPAVAGPAEEILLAVPNRQGELNRELVRCARRLRPEELAPMLDDVLAELDGSGANVRGGLERFRELCTDLARLRDVHDACQQVDTALIGALHLADPTTIPPAQIVSLQTLLKRIRTGRPADDLAETAAAAIENFQTAVQTGDRSEAEGQFALLVESFRQVFIQADRDLLAVTTRLVNEARVLDAHLQGATHVVNP